MLNFTIDLNAVNDIVREERAKTLKAQRGLLWKLVLTFSVGLGLGFLAGAA